MFSRSQSLGTPRSRPQTLELRSGWDDMLDARRSKWWSPGKKSQTSAIASGSPSPSPTSDETFIAATMDYLFSPTAKTLGLPGSGPSNHPSSSSKAAYEIPPRPTTPPLTLGSYIQHAVPSQTAPEDAKSMISSVFDASWPQPPPSPATIASSYNISPSPTLSPVSSNLNFGHPLYPATTSRGQSSPFQESYISSPNIPTLPPASARRTVPKRPSVRSLRRTLSSEKYGLSGSVPGDVIYMTVVKETS
jgi:pheromone a factor receptor